jgi:hypothetical protein
VASLRRFSHDDIEKLQLMADCGHTGTSIAKALGRTPQAVRVKCCELGIKLKPQSVANRRVRLPVPVWGKLKVAADAYGMTVVKFAALLVEAIVKDRLFDAVLDIPKRAAPTRRSRRVSADTEVRPEVLVVPAKVPTDFALLFAPPLMGRLQ